MKSILKEKARETKTTRHIVSKIATTTRFDFQLTSTLNFLDELSILKNGGVYTRSGTWHNRRHQIEKSTIDIIIYSG